MTGNFGSNNALLPTMIQ